MLQTTVHYLYSNNKILHNNKKAYLRLKQITRELKGTIDLLMPKDVLNMYKVTHHV